MCTYFGYILLTVGKTESPIIVNERLSHDPPQRKKQMKNIQFFKSLKGEK